MYGKDTILRKLIIPVMALSLGFPLSVKALGLGEIELNSALNQPFDAEIGLFASDVRNPGSIRVSLASYEDFEKAGIERLPELSDLRFKVELRSNGEPYIRVTSGKPVREPFLDFLLEVDWPSGHLIREYTVLLDLPVLLEEEPGAVEPAVSGDAADPVAPEQMVADELTPEEQAADAGDDMAAGSAPDAADTAAPQAAASGVTSGAPGENGELAGEGTSEGVAQVPVSSRPRLLPGENGKQGELYYGRVKRNDTLWEIAAEIRPEQASVPQVMMALYKSNPEAFMENNINNLKAGYVLRISNADLVYEMSRNEAARESRLHYEQWLDAKQRKAGKASQQALGAEKLDSAAVAETGAEDAGSARLKLMAPEVKEMEAAPRATVSTGDAYSDEEMASLHGQLQMALEATDMSRQENIELRERISQLEGRLAQMQRLLSLRDDTLATLQQNQGQKEAALPADRRGEDMPQAAQQADETSGMTPAAVEPGQAPMADDNRSVPPAVKQVPPEEEPGLLAGLVRTVTDMVSSSGPMVLGGIAALLALGGLAVAYSRRRGQEGMEELDFMDLQEENALPVEDVEGQAAEAGSGTGNVDIDSLDSIDESVAIGEPVELNTEIDEIDAIAEADVYIAYHLYDRAEELLRDAIEQEPERDDLKVKLLEVFAAGGNRESFVSQAEELHARVGEDSPEWRKVIALGVTVAADHELFANVEADVQADDGMSMAGDGLLSGDEFSMNDDGLEGGTVAETESPTESLDMELTADTETGEQDVSDDLSMDFESADSDDVDALPMDMAGDIGDETEGELQSEEDSLSNLMEFDTVAPDSLSSADESAQESSSEADDLTGGEASALDELSSMLDDDSNSLDFDLANEPSPDAVDDLSAMVDSEEEPESVSGSDGFESGDGIIEENPVGEELSSMVDTVDEESGDALDMDSPMADDESIDWMGAASEGDEEEGLFSGDDEVATKLDLARAYIDMGDEDSARSILNEVIQDGNDTQKQEADQLIQQIGAA